MSNIEDRFAVGLSGLSEDIEDFLLEQYDYYSENKTQFWSSFYKVCVEKLQSGGNLSHIQLDIINGEYDKVKDERKSKCLKC